MKKQSLPAVRRGATPMASKLRPSEIKRKEIASMIQSKSEDLLMDFFRKSSELVLQNSLEEEVTDFLQRDWHQQSKEPRGYRNGYYDRKIKSSEGAVNVKIPRVRDTEEEFESSILHHVRSLEKKIEKLTVEMYVRGLSTRDIEDTFVDESGKTFLSRSVVSGLTETLNEEYRLFCERDLSSYDIVYLFVDGVYESIRRYTNNQTILCAWAICSDGRKVLLHIEAAQSESEDSWSVFFEGMINRGLRQPLALISDGHKGLKNAITRVFPNAKRQRCIAHKLRNILNKVPHHVQHEVKDLVKMVYYAADRDTAEYIAGQVIEKYAEVYPAMVRCFQEDLDACLTHLDFPDGHRRLIRTTNLIERSFVEEKRRTKIIPQHQNEKGAMKLVYGTLIRSAARWQRVTMSDLDLTILKNLKKTITGKIVSDEDRISYLLAV
ncbi:MAG: IS256 family transposase [Candidatus Marinimicrobia bacterium]|nr:IS256 family transposase [Candidatus Neomarinimicrobiota bacterium]